MRAYWNRRTAFVAGLSVAGLAACGSPQAQAAMPGFWSIIQNEPLAKARKTEKPKKPKSKESATSIAPAFVVPPGPLHIVVSIDAQRATLFAGGSMVAQAPISTGTKSHPTPMGVFSVIQKNRHHVSNLYGAKMPFMQRLTWSGTALHQGPLPGYPASHGCIRLPADFAQMLWSTTRIGARVIVTRGEAAPVDIAHPRLLAPKAPETAAIGARVQTADGAGTVPGAVAHDARKPETTGSATASEQMITGSINTAKAADTPLLLTAAAIERRKKPVSVFVSRKDNRLYVRLGMEPLFDAPVTIREPHHPLGTHVFTAMEFQDAGSAMRWTVVSIPSGYKRETRPSERSEKKPPRNDKRTRPAAIETAPEPPPPAAAVLDRIEIPRDAAERIAGLLKPGSSMIVSDNGISGETGKSTDFIILTR